MTNTAKHTPTPWQITRTSCYDNNAFSVDIGVRHGTAEEGNRTAYHVLEIEALHTTVEAKRICEANAVFIVKAVNNHARLVKLAEKIATGFCTAEDKYEAEQILAAVEAQ